MFCHSIQALANSLATSQTKRSFCQVHERYPRLHLRDDQCPIDGWELSPTLVTVSKFQAIQKVFKKLESTVGRCDPIMSAVLKN